MLGRIVPLITLALLATAPDAAAQTPPSQATVVPCPVAPAVTDIEGETVICGTVSVPEDYADPDGAQIALTYALLKSISLSPAVEPVIYLHGGPGAAELKDLPALSEHFVAIRQSHDVIVFDQRGTGYSPGPLTCDVEVAVLRDDIDRAVQEELGGYGDKELAVNRALFALCLEHFADTGIDLTQYNTANNARDALTLATALGYDDQLNLYGFSYGTQIALELMRQHPDRLRAVILDSVAPADLKLYENLGQPSVEAILSLLAACADDEVCNDAFPDIEETFVTLLDRLDQEPLVHADGSLITADVVVDALHQREIRPGLGAYLPLMIWELDRGETATLDALRSGKLPPLSLSETVGTPPRRTDPALSEEARFLIDSATALQHQADGLVDLARLFLARGEEQMRLDQVGSTPAGRFDLLFQETLTPYSFDRRLALNEAYLAFPVLNDHTVEALRAFISAQFGEEDATRLLLAGASMTDEDVEELAELIFAKARTYATFFNVALVLHLIVCQEHVPYNSVDGALAALETSAIPQVARGKWRTATNLLATCQLFPTGTGDTEMPHPVASDLPALIVLGRADAQTATSWGIHAAKTLDNSRVVIFPETGHGAFRYSQCARDIGAAFLNQPDRELNIACVDTLQPTFVLPTPQ